MYHEIENPYAFLHRLCPVLAPGSRVAVIGVDKPTQPRLLTTYPG